MQAFVRVVIRAVKTALLALALGAVWLWAGDRQGPRSFRVTHWTVWPDRIRGLGLYAGWNHHRVGVTAYWESYPEGWEATRARDPGPELRGCGRTGMVVGGVRPGLRLAALVQQEVSPSVGVVRSRAGELDAPWQLRRVRLRGVRAAGGGCGGVAGRQRRVGGVAVATEAAVGSGGAVCVVRVRPAGDTGTVSGVWGVGRSGRGLNRQRRSGDRGTGPRPRGVKRAGPGRRWLEVADDTVRACC